MTQEVESLRWRIGALQRLLDRQEAETQGELRESEELLQLQQKRLAVEEKCRKYNEANEVLALQEKSCHKESVIMVKEALKAFAEGAYATFAETFQVPLIRRLTLLEDSLQRIHQPLRGLESLDQRAVRQEFLNSGHELLGTFSSLVDKDECDGYSSRLQAPLKELCEATQRWRSSI